MPAWILWLSLLSGLIACSHVQGKRISQTKCAEYINATMSDIRVVTLLIKAPTEIKSYNCSKTVNIIVGGEDAKKGEFRHQALLGWKTNKPNEYLFHCGGALISERYVLTAAHCMVKVGYEYPEPTIVRLAELDLKQKGDEFDIGIESFIKHPDHRFRTSYHDIALVRLSEQVKFSNLVRPACLWTEDNLNVSSVISTGFGDDYLTALHGSDTLRKLQLEVMDSDYCDSLVKGHSKHPFGVSEHQLCIGSSRDASDIRQGDAGGPIQVLANTRGCMYHIVGVTSWILTNGGAVAAVYTKVAAYIDWIESIVWLSE